LIHARRHRIELVRRYDLDAGQPPKLVESRIMADARRLVDLDDSTGASSLEHRVAAVDENILPTLGGVRPFRAGVGPT
jgi:hypothetical protein